MRPTFKRYPNVVRAVFETPWAIEESKLAAIVELVELRASGWEYDAAEVEQRIGAATRPMARTSGSIAVLPLFGVISHRMNMMTSMSGGTSTELFGQEFRRLVADESVGAIVIDVDSPGGTVDGVPELADEIFSARGPKPIVAVANALSASAAYWIATAADELVVTPSGQVGGIGVITAHEDASGWYEQQGIRNTLITAGKYKGEGNPYEPLGDEARAAVQARVDVYYGMFTKAVARQRGVREAEVRSGFGEGRVVGAREAVNLGMADRVETLGQTLARLSGRRAGARSVTAAELETPIIATTPSDMDRRRRRLRLEAVRQ